MRRVRRLWCLLGVQSVRGGLWRLQSLCGVQSLQPLCGVQSLQPLCGVQSLQPLCGRMRCVRRLRCQPRRDDGPGCRLWRMFGVQSMRGGLWRLQSLCGVQSLQSLCGRMRCLLGVQSMRGGLWRLQSLCGV